MKSIKFAPPPKDRLKKKPPHKDLILPPASMDTSLPPLRHVQGPFKSPEDTRNLKYLPFRPTLRVATDYDSVEIARYNAQEIYFLDINKSYFHWIGHIEWS